MLEINTPNFDELLKPNSEKFLDVVSAEMRLRKTLAKTRDKVVTMALFSPNNNIISIRRFGCKEADTFWVEGIDSNGNLCSLVGHYQTFQVQFSEVAQPSEYHEPVSIGFEVPKDQNKK